VVFGWRPAVGAERPTFATLRLDPIVLAFGPGVERLPEGAVKPLPAVGGWENEFLGGTNFPPTGADEAIGWLLYKEVLQERQRVATGLAGLWGNFSPAPGGMTFHRLAYSFLGPGRSSGPTEDAIAAIPLLALRAARRAIAADPDHPDGYFALARVLADRGLSMSDDERAAARATALRQCLNRMPPPERFRRGMYLASPSMVALMLAHLYLGSPQNPNQPGTGMPVNLPAFELLRVPMNMAGVQAAAASALVQDDVRVARAPWGQPVPPGSRVFGPFLYPLDLARDSLILAEKYAAVDSGDAAEARRKAEEIGAYLKVVDKEFTNANNLFERAKLQAGGQLKLAQQVGHAFRFNLVGEALRLLTDKDTDLGKEFGTQALQMGLTRAALELAVGRLEDAAADLEFRAAEFDEMSTRPESRRELRVDELRPALQSVTYQKLVFEGNYAMAGALMESLAAGRVGQDPPPTPEQARVKPGPLVAAPAVIPLLPLGSMLVASSPLDYVPRRELVAQLLAPYLQRQQELNALRFNASDFFFRRGVLFLMEGDIAEAKKRFQLTRRPGVPEWGVPERRHPEAERYLRLIEQAEKAEQAAKAAGK
jgi:hypothetical protein